MKAHICTVCSQQGDDHTDDCPGDCGLRYWPPLCCKGCDCGSYEQAHTAPAADPAGAALALLGDHAKTAYRADLFDQPVKAADARTGMADATAAYAIANGHRPAALCPRSGEVDHG